MHFPGCLTDMSAVVFSGRPWGVTTKRSPDGRRIWLYGEELGGTENRQLQPLQAFD